MSVFESFLTTPEVTEALSDRRFVAGMLLFHAALSRAQASSGMIPASAAQSIVGTCKVELFDVPKLTRESGRVRCLADPLLHHLRETVALFNAEAAKFVGYGCTRQNLVDTALAMVSRDALALVRTDVSRTLTTLLRLASRHATTPVLLQPAGASPALSSFGLQCVQLATPLARGLLRLNACANQALVVNLGDWSVASEERHKYLTTTAAKVASELQLDGVPACSDSRYDEWAVLASELGVLVANLGRITRSIDALMRSGLLDLVPLLADAGANTTMSAPQSASAACVVVAAAAQSAPQRVATILANLLETGSAVSSWQASLGQWHGLLSSAHGAARATSELLSAIQVNAQGIHDAMARYRASLSPREAALQLGPESLEHLVRVTEEQATLVRGQIDLTKPLEPPAAPNPPTREAPSALVLA